MDWRALLADRRVQIGGVAAAALAGVVVWRRRQQGGGSGGGAGGASAPGADSPVGAGFPNTTGTDIASWVGEELYRQQQWFTNYLRSLGLGDGLDNIPPATAPVPSRPPAVAPLPGVTVPAGAFAPVYVRPRMPGR